MVTYSLHQAPKESKNLTEPPTAQCLKSRAAAMAECGQPKFSGTKENLSFLTYKVGIKPTSRISQEEKNE